MAYDLVARLRLIDNLTNPLKAAKGGIAGIGASALKASGAIAGIGASIGAVGAAVSSVTKAMDFEAQLDSVAALDDSIAKGTAGYQKLQKLALDAGASTKYSALEAAQGMEQLVKAGMSVETVMSGGLDASLNLASAGGVKVAEAAEVMAIALNSFKKDGMSAADAANILAGTANAAATGVNELRYGIASVGAVASGLGMTFKDTSAALGLFTNNGLGAQDAGTSFKTMLANLQPTTKGQIALFKKLGLVTADGANKFFDAKGNVQSLENIAGTLKQSLAGLTAQQRDLALQTMFGSDAIRAGNILFEEGADGVRKFNDQLKNGPTALDIAKKKMDNASGAVEQFKGALETLQIAAMTPLLPKIKDLALGAADLSTKLQTWLGSDQAASWGNEITFAVNTAIGVVKDLLSAAQDVYGFINNNWTLIAPIVGGVVASYAAWKIATIAMNTWTKVLTASQWLLSAAMTMTPFGWVVLAIGALVSAGIALYQNWDTVSAAAGKMWTFIKDAFATGVNFVVGLLNDYLGLWNKILKVVGVEIPAIDLHMKTSSEKMADSARVAPDIVETGASMRARSHASGLSRVPYNGYLARLHKDEEVLTPEAAAARRGDAGAGSGGGGSFTFGDIHINGASGNVEEMADELMRVIARRVAEAGGQM